MHARALEIAWHDSTSIWSVHISRGNRLLTAGGDKVARVWRLCTTPHETLRRITDSTTTKAVIAKSQASLVDWLCDLRAHTTTVNVARFSRDGFTIATGADGGEIVLWAYEDGQPVKSLSDADAPLPKERWVRLATLRGHVQDVLDLAWSSDGSRLVSASIDNAIKVWDVKNSTKTPVTLRSHANFVQGVSIDPFGRLIASLGNDRALRIFTSSNSNSWYQVASVSSHMDNNDSRLFIDDAKFKNCFRRLSWSPDGSVVACPSGMHLPHANRLFAVHIFARNIWHRPAAQCGGLTKPACAVRFSPVLYELRGVKEKRDGVDVAPGKTGKGPFASFKYRMVFAVLCVDAVLFYDTEALTRPFAMVEGLHCAENTDISWSSDGLTVAISSVDGYVSFVSFTKEELGIPLALENTPPWLNRQEELEKPVTSRSPRKSKVSVTVVRPKPGNDAAAGSNRPALHFPPPGGIINNGNESTSQSIPAPSPPASDGSAKAMVSLSPIDVQSANVTKTANGGQRVSVATPANQQSLTTPKQAGGMHRDIETTENAMREAMSEMLMTEHSQSPISASRQPKGRCVTNLKQDVSGEHEEENHARAETKIESTQKKPDHDFQQTESTTSVEPECLSTPHKEPKSTIEVSSYPGKAVSVDPASPLKSCTTVIPSATAALSTSVALNSTTVPNRTMIPKTSKLSPPTPSLTKRLTDIARGTSETLEATPKTLAPKNRPKSGKVQTTLFSFTGGSKKSPDKPTQRQSVPENRKVSSDAPLQHGGVSSSKRKLGVVASHAQEDDDEVQIVEPQEESVPRDATSGDAKRRKLMERAEPNQP